MTLLFTYEFFGPSAKEKNFLKGIKSYRRPKGAGGYQKPLWLHANVCTGKALVMDFSSLTGPEILWNNGVPVFCCWFLFGWFFFLIHQVCHGNIEMICEKKINRQARNDWELSLLMSKPWKLWVLHEFHKKGQARHFHLYGLGKKNLRENCITLVYALKRKKSRLSRHFVVWLK